MTMQREPNVGDFIETKEGVALGPVKHVVGEFIWYDKSVSNNEILRRVPWKFHCYPNMDIRIRETSNDNDS